MYPSFLLCGNQMIRTELFNFCTARRFCRFSLALRYWSPCPCNIFNLVCFFNRPNNFCHLPPSTLEKPRFLGPPLCSLPLSASLSAFVSDLGCLYFAGVRGAASQLPLSSCFFLSSLVYRVIRRDLERRSKWREQWRAEEKKKREGWRKRAVTWTSRSEGILKNLTATFRDSKSDHRAFHSLAFTVMGMDLLYLLFKSWVFTNCLQQISKKLCSMSWCLNMSMSITRTFGTNR